MLEKDTIIKVTNTTSGRVGYLIPDLGNLHRGFTPGETKEITFDELRKLAFTPGGEALLRNHLTIESKEALKSILGDVEPEYFYTKEDIIKLLTTGNIDQFKDFLDFAPEGMINLAKDLAVSMEISDIRKRDAIKAKTGFDVTKAIEINHATGEEEQEEVKVRRTTPINETSTESTGRRTTAYKVVSQE